MDKTQITHAMLGTTQCTNAIVERKSWPKSASFVWVTRQPLPLRRTRPGLRTWFSRCRVNMLSFMADMNMTAKCLEKSMKLKLKLFRGMGSRVESIAVIGVFSSIKMIRSFRFAISSIKYMDRNSLFPAPP